MFKKLKNKINNIIIKRNLKKINVYIKNNVKLNTNSVFEGFSIIYNDVDVRDTFVGKGTYICQDSKFVNCKIGRFCSIGRNSKVIYGSHPTYDYISTHPSFYSSEKQAGFSFVDYTRFKERNLIDEKYSVEVGNDVWIGENVSILEGVKIGDGAIIGANSLVVKDIEPYSINGGVPTKLIRYRFNSNQIEKLLNFRWWNFSIEELKRNAIHFNNIENIELICSSKLENK